MVALAGIRYSTTAGESPLWFANQAGAAPQNLYGHPVFFSDACQTLNSPGDIVLGNWSEYLYIVGPVVVEASRDYDFNKDRTTYRLKLRDGGQPMRASTLTDGQSYEMSNFITLATRS